MTPLIKLRQSALNLLLFPSARQVLNPPGANGRHPDHRGQTLPASQVAEQLSRTVKQFKALAMDETGAHVDYPRLRTTDAYRQFRTGLTSQLPHLALSTLETREQRLAFWINLYNALVIDGVISHNIRRSVTEGRLGLIRFFNRTAYNVGGFRFSLEDIEHGILRANRGSPYLPGPHFPSTDPRLAFSISPLEPRLHFALNCASLSCPPIAAYSAPQLAAQLSLAARNFVAQETHLDPSRDRLRVSALFKWFSADFGGRSGVLAFLQQHLPEDERRAWLLDRGGQAKLGFLPYHWGLNI